MGRPIAEVMSFQAADWLFRDTREQEEQPDAMLDSLKIRPGDVVADVGAGRLHEPAPGPARGADRQGPGDRRPARMLQMLASNAREAGLKNIQPIRCTHTETGLPPGKVDLAILIDVYHECSDPGPRSGACSRP